MYKIRLWATALLVALCTGFYSCSESEDSEEDTLEALFLEYGITDYKDIEMPSCSSIWHYIVDEKENDRKQTNFTGLKNDHLWIASFDTETKQKIFEWIDTREFERTFRIDLGYGEYEDRHITWINVPQTYSYENSFVAEVCMSGKGTIYILKTPTITKEIIPKTSLGILKGWHKDSFFIDDACYSFDGNIRYTTSIYPTGVPVSYEEGIIASAFSITRYNYKEGKVMWDTYITPPFDIPSDARNTITLLDNSTNIWKYRVDYTFYDGTKKAHTFSINIDNGEIQ
ncbi:hypothetical protein [Bacteroides thetaiotaomicron]|uniref:hypothetical protein n=1 Tax=Bacteroides thetaiotaomicron TaxID=818 RepID=UPI0035669489